MCSISDELENVKKDLELSNKICEELSEKINYGIWKADSENEIYFKNKFFDSLFTCNPKSLDDIFSDDEILLFEHNNRLEFEYDISGKLYKIVFERLENGKSYGIIRPVDRDDDTLLQLMILKKEVKQILEDYR